MTIFSEVPSPFCGIGTDDLTIDVEGSQVKVTENGCAVNTPAFELEIKDTSPRVEGKETSLNEAIKKAVQIISAANQPVIGGCATDVNGMRALLSLADHQGCVVDHMNFDASRRNLLALQDSGWMNTTLAEIKNRCDLLLVIGCDPEKFAPRFYEHFLWNEESMFLKKTSQRKVVYLGTRPEGIKAHSPDNTPPQVIECDQKDIPEIMATLRALVKQNILTTESLAGISLTVLAELANALKSAQYGVITWSAEAFDFTQAEIAVQSLCELVKDVNLSGTRCSGFPLGGKQGDQTANQVTGWQTGYPARMRFSSGFPEYDPYLYSAATMIHNHECDALLWVQAFDSNALPPETDNNIPVIVLGRSGMVFEHEPDVFIPIGTPGIDHAGHTFRLDNVVAIRLKKLRDSGLPSTASILNAIENELQE